MEGMMEFNINLFVYFRPSETGLEILKREYRKWSEKDLDENGFYHMQMWIFMEIFGDVFKKTMESPVVDCEIFFKKKHLREVKDDREETQS